MLEAAFIITVSAFIALLAAFFISVVIAVGWRDKYLTAYDANRNAGYWAESEAKREEFNQTIREGKALIAQYDHVLALHKQRADDLSRIAGEALRIAHHQEFSPPDDFQSAKRLPGQASYPPDEWPEVFD